MFTQHRLYLLAGQTFRTPNVEPFRTDMGSVETQRPQHFKDQLPAVRRQQSRISRALTIKTSMPTVFKEAKVRHMIKRRNQKIKKAVTSSRRPVQVAGRIPAHCLPNTRQPILDTPF